MGVSVKFTDLDTAHLSIKTAETVHIPSGQSRNPFVENHLMVPEKSWRFGSSVTECDARVRFYEAWQNFFFNWSKPRNNKHSQKSNVIFNCGRSIDKCIQTSQHGVPRVPDY